MKAAGLTQYDYTVKLDLKVSLDLGSLGSIDFSKAFGLGREAVKGIINKSPIKPGNKAKGKAGDAAPIVESKVVKSKTTDNQVEDKTL